MYINHINASSPFVQDPVSILYSQDIELGVVVKHIVWKRRDAIVM